MNKTSWKATGAIVLAAGMLSAQTPQRTFATPEAAVDALIAAVKSGNTDEMAAVLGEEMREQFRPGDPVLSDLDRAEYLQAAQIAKKIENDAIPDHLILYVGANEWPFPAPLVKDGDGWRFDGKAGRQEVLDRRIGHNEMHTVEICFGYVEAQTDYARTDHDGNGILEFAQHLISTPDRHDGLYWRDGTGSSPFGPSVAESDRLVSPGDAAGTATTPRPRHHRGYHFRILTAQGENAVGGARNFLIEGHLLGGFGLIAWPKEYGATGIQTFIVNQLGVVYAKDLGADTATVAPAISAFNPDPSWKKLDPAE